jgi:hypothetical protein
MHNFTVDLQAREVRHASGAAASFYEYRSEADWRATDCVTLHNPDLYDGPAEELGRLAKEAALAAGMRCQRRLD